MPPPEVIAEVSQWVEAAARQEISWSELAERILRFEQLSMQHRPDVDRRRRCGFSEVIYGAGKSAVDIIQITRRLLDRTDAQVLVTRFESRDLSQVAGQFPFTRYDSLARTLRLSNCPIAEVYDRRGTDTSDSNSHRGGKVNSPALPRTVADDAGCDVVVVTAGSTDLPVAREALETLRWMGIRPGFITDVGVAGPYRLLGHLPRLRAARAIVVVAGMEGALASVMGGLVACPVIAVPTSVGYGSNLAGVTTLLSMLSSCAAGVTVVNIDGGFKGGYVAGLIASGDRAVSR
jgi:pyridinium-3,5-biscarboxylic acid mononucleotide synthase